MAKGDKYWCAIYTILVLWNMKQFVQSEPQVPCHFILGDSLLDNGNNNNLTTTAKANYLPYGIDFHDGPTGRFSNGLNIVDVLNEILGFETFIPPFATTKDQDMARGVNYASGGAGIRNETGEHLGEVISLSNQVQNHQTTVTHIEKLLQSKEDAREHLNQCLYTVGIGSNDYINNYLMPEHYKSSHLYSPNEYASLLIQEYSEQLEALYNLGARKVAIFGLHLIGCTPAERQKDLCVDSINEAVQLFNNRLKPLVTYFNNHLRDAKFVLINFASLLGNPNSTINGILSPCCAVSTNIAEGQCVAGQLPCRDRNLHVFYDNFHPTEFANRFLAARAYISILPMDVYPFGIQRLVQL